MRLRFVWVGKTKHPPVRELIEHYRERISRFESIEVTEVRDCTDVGRDPKRIIEEEGRNILERIGGDPCVVALDEKGRQLDSLQLAEFIRNHRDRGTRRMTFVIGGHNGLAEEVRQGAHLVLGLSKMTLPHELARVFLLEQVYRAFTIIKELPYQK
jgi:23S rRNA (pseudouridine1915-N3)-methyltransferase